MTTSRTHAAARLALLVLLAPLLAACGGAGGATDASIEPVAAAEPPAADAADAAGTAGAGGGAKGGAPAAVVRLEAVRFEPTKVEVAVGETVEWRWARKVLHNIKGGPLDKGNAAEGTYRHTFEKAGTFRYDCTIHPGMTGTVVVR